MEKEYCPDICDVCGMRFMHTNKLKQHIVIHLPSDQRPYKCKICENTFTGHNQFKKHRLTHIGPKLFQCNICDRRYNQASDLSYHIMVHDQSKQRPCLTCGRNFGSDQALKMHMRKHLPKESCPFCKKMFLQRNLERHIKMHDNGKMLYCRICCKWILSMDNLETHFAMHNRKRIEEHVCSICDRKFVRLWHYENHLIMHSGYTAYACEQCDKSFFSAGGYNRHMKVHGDMKIQPAKGIEKRGEHEIPTKSLELSDFPVLSNRSNGCSQNDFSPYAYNYIRSPLESTSGERHVFHEKSIPPTRVEEEDVNEMASELSEFTTFGLPPVLSGQSNLCPQNDFSPHTRFLKSTSDERDVVHGYTESTPTMEVKEEDENEIASKSSEFFPSDLPSAGFGQYSYQNSKTVIHAIDNKTYVSL